MEWFLVTMVLSIPLLLNIAAVLLWRGPSRGAAAIVLLVLGSAFAADAYSAYHHGNLTGLFTIIAALPSLILLLLIWAVSLAVGLGRQRSGEKRKEDNADSSAVERSSEGEQ